MSITHKPSFLTLQCLNLLMHNLHPYTWGSDRDNLWQELFPVTDQLLKQTQEFQLPAELQSWVEALHETFAAGPPLLESACHYQVINQYLDWLKQHCLTYSGWRALTYPAWQEGNLWCCRWSENELEAYLQALDHRDHPNKALPAKHLSPQAYQHMMFVIPRATDPYDTLHQDQLPDYHTFMQALQWSEGPYQQFYQNYLQRL